MNPNGKNKRDVWSVPSQKFKGLHSAVMPVPIAETCVLACSEPADVVLDPFCGAATTGVAALTNGRKFLGVDLLPRFVQMSRERLAELTDRAASQATLAPVLAQGSQSGGTVCTCT